MLIFRTAYIYNLLVRMLISACMDGIQMPNLEQNGSIRYDYEYTERELKEFVPVIHTVILFLQWNCILPYVVKIPFKKNA